jgi:hypothetical protein
VGIVLFKCSPCGLIGFWFSRSFICWFRLPLCVGVRGRNLAKIRLFIRVRSDSRCSIASVPLKELVRLSGFPKKRWSFEDGWLILEAF